MRLVGKSAALEEQVRLMRDELLKAVDGIKKRDAVIEKLTRANEDLALKLAERERRLALYENSNTPSSEESVIQKHEKRKRRQQLKAEGDSGTKPRKPGRKEGHKGASHNRKSDGKVYNTPGKCDHCGSKNLAVSRNNPIQRTDIEPIVVHTITIVNQECECLDCGQATVQDGPDTGHLVRPQPPKDRLAAVGRQRARVADSEICGRDDRGEDIRRGSPELPQGVRQKAGAGSRGDQEIRSRGRIRQYRRDEGVEERQDVPRLDICNHVRNVVPDCRQPGECRSGCPLSVSLREGGMRRIRRI